MFNKIKNIYNKYLTTIFNYTNTVYLISSVSILPFSKRPLKAYQVNIFSIIAYSTTLVIINTIRMIQKDKESRLNKLYFVYNNLLHSFLMLAFIPYIFAVIGLYKNIGEKYPKGIVTSNLFQIVGEILTSMSLKIFTLYMVNQFKKEIYNIEIKTVRENPSILHDDNNIKSLLLKDENLSLARINKNLLKAYIHDNNYYNVINKRLHELELWEIMIDPVSTLYLLSGIIILISSLFIKIDEANFLYYLLNFIIATSLVAYSAFNKYQSYMNINGIYNKMISTLKYILSDPFNLNNTISTGIGIATMTYKKCIIEKKSISTIDSLDISKGIFTRTVSISIISMGYIIINSFNIYRTSNINKNQYSDLELQNPNTINKFRAHLGKNNIDRNKFSSTKLLNNKRCNSDSHLYLKGGHLLFNI